MARYSHLGLFVAAATACSLLPLHAPAFAAESELGGLHWGIRSSFNNYTSGATFVDEGATDENGEFVFPLQSYTFDAATEHAEAVFSGRVQYRKYCAGKKENEKNLAISCDLDLVFKNPKIVIDPNGSYLEATVSSKQYPDGGVFAPPAPVKIATLSTAGGTFKKADGRVNWSGVPTQLTEEAVKMFSGFYEAGEGLDPLSFTAQGDGKKLSTDSVSLKTVKEAWRSPATYDEYHDLHAVRDKALVAVSGHGLYLIDTNLKEVAKTEFPMSLNGVGDYDAQNGYYYYTESPSQSDRLTNTIKRVRVTPTSLGEPETVGTVPGKVYAIGVHDKTGKIIAISAENVAGAADISKIKAYLTTIDGTTLSTPLELPKSSDLWGSKLTYDNLYAPNFLPAPMTNKLLSMDDGTFAYAPVVAPYPEGTNTAVRTQMLSIDPSKTTAAEAVTLMGKPDHNRADFMPGSATNGSKIIRWNGAVIHPANEIQSLDYANRELTVGPLIHSQHLLGVAGAAWDTEGRLVILDGSKGKLVWVDADTLTPLQEDGEPKEYTLPNGRETFNKYQANFLAQPDGSFYVPSLNEQGSFQERYELRRLVDPTKTPIETETPEEKKQRQEEEARQLSKRIYEESYATAVKAIETYAEAKAAGQDTAELKAAMDKAVSTYREAVKAFEVRWPNETVKELPEVSNEAPSTTPEPTQPSVTTQPSIPGQPLIPGSSQSQKPEVFVGVATALLTLIHILGAFVARNFQALRAIFKF